MYKMKKIIAIMLSLVMIFLGVVPANSVKAASNEEQGILEAYRNGYKMEPWIIETRKQVAEELGLTEYLDERYFLNEEYRNEHFGIGKEITDPRINILIEMTSDEEYEEMVNVLRSNINTFSLANGDTVGVTQQARLSGAGNGYFTVDGASSFGYCAQNSLKFWGNNETKYGPVSEWDDATVRKVLYYAPGGAGYEGPYYGSQGADMDYATFALGKLNGDTKNNTKANRYISLVSNKTDPIVYGHKAFKVDITPNSFQDVGFLVYTPVIKNGKVTLQKASANTTITNNNNYYSLEGAVYGIYSSESLSGASRVGTLTTNANGLSNTVELTVGDYWVYELTAPKGYAKDNTKYKVTIAANENKILKVFDNPHGDPVNILLQKKDAETGLTTPQGNGSLANAEYTFKFFAGEYAEGVNPETLGKTPTRTWVFATDKNGVIRFNKSHLVSGELYYNKDNVAFMPFGTLVIQETKAPAGYYINSEIFVRRLTGASVSGVSTYNIPISKEEVNVLTITKYLNGTMTPIEGVEFQLTKPDGTTSNHTTDSNGKITLKGLPSGKYSLKEISTVNGMLLSSEIYTFTINNDGTFSGTTGTDYTFTTDSKGNGLISVTNVRQTGNIELTKVDSKTGNEAQGEATLEGAVYGLYANENILEPVTGKVIAKKNEKVAELTTDKNAFASISDLYLGKYYVQEIKPSNGYTLDKTKYEIELTSDDQTVSVITKGITVYERVISQAFSIIKISADESDEVELLKGAEFTIKAQKDIDKYGSWEAAPIAKNASGEEAAIMITDEKGYAVSDRLPIGTYVVRETKVPENKFPVEDFTVVVTKDSDKPQPYRVLNDKPFKAVLKIVKKDAETGKTVLVPGAKFKIKNVDTGEYFGYWNWDILDGFYTDTWTTDESGMIMTGGVLKPGNYQLEEIEAPEGYLLSKEPIPFKISMDTPYEILPDGKTPVITVIQKDTSAKGKVIVEKQGEVLTGIKNKENGNIEFIYKKQGIANTKYELLARKDILDPSGDGTILYKKGTVVDTITTGENGKGQSKLLPLGEYSIKEVQAPNGFVISSEVKNVSLTYQDSNTAIVYEETGFVNERQKIELTITKKDKDENIGLFGAEFGLYASEDIHNNKGETVVKKGTLIEKEISDSDGKVAFKADLPLSNYEVKEIKAPIGYSSSDKVLSFDATYKGQDIEVIQLQSEFKNEITKVEVSKQDITDNSEIEGAHLTIFEKDEPASVFDSWISGQDGKNEDGTIKPHLIKGLEVGKTYVLRETSSPHGFAISQDIEFTVEDTGVIQKVIMKDEVVFGKLEWNKEGEIFNQTVFGQTEFGQTESPVWSKSNLLGAEITIFADEDIVIGNKTYYKKDEKIQILESDWESVTSKELPVGRYYYIETKVPHGYIEDTQKHYFEVQDTQKNEVQKITSSLKNHRSKVNIDMKKLLEEQKIFINKDAYKDIVFGIFAREDIYDYMGNVAIKNGTMIYTSGINEDGTLTLANKLDLPNGVYYIQELATNDQYVLNDKQYDFEISYQGKDVNEYTVQIGIEGKIENKLARGTVEVQKVDSLDGKKLEGVEFNISSDEDMKNIIKTVKTNKDGIAAFTELELGTYYIQEKEQVDGYVLNDHIYTVEVKKDGERYSINCENQPTLMEFSKVGETGTNELEGATIQVIDKETGKIIDEWVSTTEEHKIYYLIEGKEYIMKEISAPYGYEIAEEITFVAGDGKKVTMKDKLILTDIQVNKVDSVTKESIKSKDFVFGIYSDKACTQLIEKVHANKENGTATFKDLKYGTYYIKEIEAPKGYKLSDEVKEIIINDDLEGVGSVHSFVYENILLPAILVQTGDNTSIALIIGGGIVSLFGIGVIAMRRKKDEEE